MNILDAENIREVRAAVLGACYDNHRAGNHRLRLIQLEGVLERLFFDVSRNDLIMILDDLMERGYVTFEKRRDQWTHEVTLGEIGILPAGRNLVERTEKDPAVKFD